MPRDTQSERVKKTRSKKMDELSLVQTVHREIESAMGAISGELSDERSKALSYYMREPYGNEVDGRSEVVTSEVHDHIEWLMPQLIDVFTSTDQAVKFEPYGAEDIAQAAQETDYTNYVFYKDNDGFLILYTWLKDGLLSKNGIVKVYWNETDDSFVTNYEGLDPLQFEAVIRKPENDVIEAEEIIADGEEPVYNLKVRTHNYAGKVCIEPIPPEDLFVSRDANSIDLDKADFVCHRVKTTKSNLLKQGYPKDKVENIAIGDAADRYNEEWWNRRTLDDERWNEGEWKGAVDYIWIYECYLRIDFDGDGLDELRKVTVTGGSNGQVLDNEEIDVIPLVAWTPNIRTHLFNGISIADEIMDLQLVKSTLLRQILDNLYLINNQRTTVVEGQVDLDDLLTSRPGGVVRQKQPGMVEALPQHPLPSSAYDMMGYLDQLGESRTGVTKFSQGLDPESLARSPAGGVEKILTASKGKVKLIARLFAETGLKKMFQKIHSLTLKHQQKRRMVMLRNKWVTVDPCEWRYRYNSTVTVGLGNIEEQQQIAYLNDILAKQKDIIESGGLDVLVTMDQVYNTLSRLVESSGMKDPSLYFTNPEGKQPKKKTSDQEKALMAQVQLENQKLGIEIDKLKHEQRKLAVNAEIEAAKIEQDATKTATEAQIDVLKISSTSDRDAKKQSLNEAKFAAEKRLREVQTAIDAIELQDEVEGE